MYVYRHSTAHLLAAAVLELYPETKLGIGPPIENGFYYDFDRAHRRSRPKTWKRSRRRCGRSRSAICPTSASIPARTKGCSKYADAWMKCELITERAGEIFTEYTLGPHFIDFCRGPHVPDTSKIKAFKLLSIAGAYWKGDEQNKQLQRIYGTAFFTQKELEEYLNRLEEAKRRDHRKLGKELELFTVNEAVGAGLPLWLPKGATIRRLLEEYILERERATGYQHVYTPDLAKVDLYQRSGHWEHYKDDMFPPMDLETEQMVLRPMNCPHHILVYESKQRSYRDLPVQDRRAGHHVPLRTLGRAQRTQPRARHDPERRPHFLHAGPDQGRIHQRDAAGGAGLQGPRALRSTATGFRCATRRRRKSTSTTTRCGRSASACCARPWIRSACRTWKPRARRRSTGPSSISSLPT